MALKDKQIEVVDNGIKMQFVVKQMPVITASIIGVKIANIMSDKDTTQLLVTRQIFLSMLGSNSKIEGADAEAVKKIVSGSVDVIISSVISSLLAGLSDAEKQKELITEIFNASVVYKNGTQLVGGVDVINNDYITSVDVLWWDIIKEVLTLTYAGVIDRLKKHLAPQLRATDSTQKAV